MKTHGSVTLNVEITNTGSRKGAEVVQLYIRDDYSSVPRPVKELKGFKKIWLEPGKSQMVQFVITPEMLSFYDKNRKWVVEPGDFTLMVGGSSDNTQNIKLTVVK